MSKIAIVRIRGDVGLDSDIRETFKRLRLPRKYSCRVFENPNEVELGMLKKIGNFVAFGEISDEVHKKLDGQRKQKIKNFYRLHPPRKGIDSKKHFGVDKGVLGNNQKEINKLIERML